MNRTLREDDSGSVTVVGALVILALVALSLVVVLGVSWLVQAHKARAAADLTALSAASVLQYAGHDQACSTAVEVAERNSAELLSCALIDGGQTPYGTPGEQGVSVEVTVSGRSASAAAGPVA